MPGRGRTDALDRTSDRDDPLRQTCAEIRHPERGVELGQQPLLDPVIVPFAGRVHARADPGAGELEIHPVQAFADDVGIAILLGFVRGQPHRLGHQPLARVAAAAMHHDRMPALRGARRFRPALQSIQSRVGRNGVPSRRQATTVEAVVATARASIVGWPASAIARRLARPGAVHQSASTGDDPPCPQVEHADTDAAGAEIEPEEQAHPAAPPRRCRSRGIMR